MILTVVNIECPICMGRAMNVLFFHPFGHIFLPLYEVMKDHDDVLLLTGNPGEPLFYDPAANVYHVGMPDNPLLQYEIISALARIHSEAIKHEIKDFIALPAPMITMFNEVFYEMGREAKIEHLPDEDLIDAHFNVLSKLSDILKLWP